MSDLKLELYRENSKDDGTISALLNGDDEVCRLLELPWRENEQSISCIPPARYWVDYLAESASGHYKDVYHITGVPGRSGILIHKGNYAGDESLGFMSDSAGCLLPCVSIGKSFNQTMGQDSKTALQRLHEVTGRKGFWLEVWGI